MHMQVDTAPLTYAQITFKHTLTHRLCIEIWKSFLMLSPEAGSFSHRCHLVLHAGVVLPELAQQQLEQTERPEQSPQLGQVGGEFADRRVPHWESVRHIHTFT